VDEGAVWGSWGTSVFTVNMNDGSLTPVSRTGPEFDDLNGGRHAVGGRHGRFALECPGEGISDRSEVRVLAICPSRDGLQSSRKPRSGN